MPKKEQQSHFSQLLDMIDTDASGDISAEEIAQAKQIADFDHKLKQADASNKRLDQIRKMNWAALIGMLFYPLIVLFTDAFGLSDASAKIADMSSIYFVSVMGIISVFIGGEAYKGKDSK